MDQIAASGSLSPAIGRAASGIRSVAGSSFPRADSPVERDTQPGRRRINPDVSFRRTESDEGVPAANVMHAALRPVLLM